MNAGSFTATNSPAVPLPCSVAAFSFASPFTDTTLSSTARVRLSRSSTSRGSPCAPKSTGRLGHAVRKRHKHAAVLTPCYYPDLLMGFDELMHLVRQGGLTTALILLASVFALGVAIERLLALWGVRTQTKVLGETIARH